MPETTSDQSDTGPVFGSLTISAEENFDDFVTNAAVKLEDTPAEHVTRFNDILPGVYLELHSPPGYEGEQGSQTIARALEVLNCALQTMSAKDRLYAGAWREQGWMGNLARIQSKVGRLRNMLWQEYPINDKESADDSLLDLINLAVFAILNRQGGNRWGRGDGSV